MSNEKMTLEEAALVYAEWTGPVREDVKEAMSVLIPRRTASARDFADKASEVLAAKVRRLQVELLEMAKRSGEHQGKLIALQRRTKWKSIKTAPRDGTSILLLCENIRDGERLLFATVGWREKRFNEWIWTNGWSEADESTVELQPTHWMSLPDGIEIPEETQ